jgi:hypothetical protein
LLGPSTVTVYTQRGVDEVARGAAGAGWEIGFKAGYDAALAHVLARAHDPNIVRWN